MADIHFAFEAIGTQWVIDIFQPPAEVNPTSLETKIHHLIDEYDQTYSRFRSDSLVTKMSQESGTFELPHHAEVLLHTYRQLYDQTNGRFTPLIGRLLADAGYDAEYSFESQPLQMLPTWDEAFSVTGSTITINQPTLLDFGAGGKGQLVDLIATLLEAEGCTNFCVDGSGDLVQRSSTQQKLRIGLEHPDQFDQVIGVAEIFNQSLCASAGNRRKWPGYHHIIDPQTLHSPDSIIATWVVADTALKADAISTALFLVPATQLFNSYAFEYAALKTDYSLESSSSFPGEFFIQS